MIKRNAINDTIFVVKRDTIIKIVESVKEPAVNANGFVQHFNEYSNCYTALATIAAFAALFITIKASNKSSREARHQILCGKLEEICDLLSTFASDYCILYNAYNTFYNEENKTKVSRILNKKKFDIQWHHVISEINLDMYFEKLSRLQVLTNLYLGNKPNAFTSFPGSTGRNTLKFNILGSIEIFNSLLMVIKHQELKDSSFYPEKLPPVEKTVMFLRHILEELSKKIDYGYTDKGYSNYRDGTLRKLFKEN